MGNPSDLEIRIWTMFISDDTREAQEYWSGWPIPSPGDLPHPGVKLGLLHCRWILYQLSYQGSPSF